VSSIGPNTPLGGRTVWEDEAFGVFFNVAKGVKVLSRKHIGKVDSEEVAEVPKV
jgi:hypothetical protein